MWVIVTRTLSGRLVDFSIEVGPEVQFQDDKLKENKFISVYRTGWLGVNELQAEYNRTYPTGLPDEKKFTPNLALRG